MSKKAAVVLTTINVPTLLEAYADNFEKFGRMEDAYVIVIPDLKTPPEAGEFVQKMKLRGLDVDYVEMARQESWLAQFPDLKALIPYNSDNRRNIGFLMAAERGCDLLISIDDDNYCTPDEDFYGGHAIVGSVQTRPCIASKNGWFNICSMLDNTHQRVLYPRGYPFRWRDQDAEYDERPGAGYIAANAGLWTHDPDIDAVTRLNNEHVKMTGINRGSIMLAPRTQSPVNSQNTALIPEAIAAYYFVLMGETIDGWKLDRYGDIWSGYFLGKCVEHMRHYIGIGAPVAFHKRNQHDFFKDLRQELGCMILTESLVKMLEKIELKGATYLDTYRSLSFELEKAVRETADPYFTLEVRKYFVKIAKAMRVWVDVFQELTANRLNSSKRSGVPIS